MSRKGDFQMIAPNTLLQNRYLVLKQIGQGGMGAVYIATDQRFGSTVALKETFFTDPNLRKAFEREARLLNHLRHPALPRVSDHFVEDEGQFLVMEYIAGDDLAEKLRERGGAFTLSEVLNWADQLLDALDYLHTQEPSVIHRDIKPQNLKLTARNAIVLLDFGLAKGSAAMQTKVTATGSVFGYSRNYAPLEQIQGAGTDPRSDLYSLAATLYHLITGVTPPDALTRATAVLNGQPDPLLPANEVHAQVPPAVANVLSKAMAQNASQRPQTASAMRDAMREAARQGHSLTRDTNTQSIPSSNVYEQDTQLMFAATPQTKTGEAVDETEAVKPAAAATNINSMPAVSSTASKDSSESVLTKVAGAAPTTLKSQPRKRIFAIAASAVVLMVVAAAVYTFTRNNNTTTTAPPIEPAQQNVQTEPIVPQTSNTKDEHPMKVVIIEDGKDATTTTTAPAPTVRHTSPPKTAKSNPNVASDEDDEPEARGSNEPPEPPDPNEMNWPRTRPRNMPRPGEPGFEEAIRAAEEQRRAGEEARRAAQEQRRLMLIQQRELLKLKQRQRQRQQQQQQQYP
jgi:serine/threonine protein kinase